MNRLTVLVTAFVGLASCAQQPFTTPDDREPARKNVVINFSEAEVMPSVARVETGGSVAFSNLGSQAGVVVLPASMAEKMSCDKRPDFGEVAGGNYESITIRGEAEDVVLPCLPPPGEYSYTINLFEDLMNRDNPAFRLSGRIVVE